MTNNHIGLDTMYDNNHGNESISIINALSGILNNARDDGAINMDCDEVRSEILMSILSTPRECIKDMLQSGNFKVLVDGGFMDVGYLLSLRF